MFVALEKEVGVPSAMALIRCRHIWAKGCQYLLKTSAVPNLTDMQCVYHDYSSRSTVDELFPDLKKNSALFQELLWELVVNV